MSRALHDWWWRTYWRRRADGGHRDSSDAALRADAEAKALLLQGGGRLLDVGCGGCELTVHLAPHFATVVGIEPSPAMRAAAITRMQRAGATHAQILAGDHGSVASLLPHRFDRVIANQVLQYLSPDQIRTLLHGIAQVLDADGIVLLADIPDPVQLAEQRAEWRRRGRWGWLRRWRDGLLQGAGLPEDGMGHGHDWPALAQLCAAGGWAAERLPSAVYSYRYHVRLSRATPS